MGTGEVDLGSGYRSQRWDSSCFHCAHANTHRLDAQEREVKNEQDPYSSTTDSDDDSLEFSLITGTLRTKKRFATGNGGQASDSNNLLEDRVRDLTLRNQNFSLSKLESAGSTFLASREFQGLQPRYGMDEPSVLEQGRSGVARGYTEEK